MNKVLVLGSLNMDMTIYIDRIPAMGETVTGNDFLLSPGGKGANQAVAASLLGGQVTMLGCVGNDVFGGALKQTLAEAGVETKHIEICPDISTGVASITVCGGDNRIALFGGANHRVSRRQVDLALPLMEDCDALLIQLEIPLDTVLYAVEQAHRLQKPVFFNPAPAQPLPVELYPKIHYFLPNESEASLLLNRPLSSDLDIFEALEVFKSMGIKEPIITLGARGVACYLNGKPVIRKGYKVSAVDTTAAGDTFIGALSATIGKTASFADAIDFAQKAAAICVTRQGAQKTIPTLQEVHAWRPITE